ncbi:MAG: prepilin-type N-terminal cleavage/methylation domain-containing protein [Anaerohalosphaera sp.]|nr:prepilin-type N-terminal cleavage/methylation domain-containing protein [Anaerohalosphaera sp.]
MKNARKKHGFTLIELLVVISIIALLLAILMPALGRVKKQARKTVCMTSTRSFGLAFMLYASDFNDIIIPLYFRTEGKFWSEKLIEYYDSDDLRICPEATKPLSPASEFVHENLGRANYGAPDKAWYHIRAESGKPDETYFGSYGTNGWAHKGEGQTWGYAYEDHWEKMSSPGGSKIPLMMDCTWVAGYPFATDSPLPADEYYNYWFGSYSYGQMNRYCFDRHDKYICTTFFDGSTRAVPCEELWTLKWHQSYRQPNVDIVIEW